MAIAERIRTVAVVDDDPEQADAMAELVREAGFMPVVLGPKFARVHDLVDRVRAEADAAVCDHRLRWRGYAPFDGAEAVATMVEGSIPAVLVTQYTDSDAAGSIRRWRRNVPVLLRRADADANRIKEALGECAREIQGAYGSGRRPRRTLVLIEDIVRDIGVNLVEARVPSWNPLESVRFPISLMPLELSQALQPGSILFARVNIGAEQGSDLFFEDFESSPAPLREDELG